MAAASGNFGRNRSFADAATAGFCYCASGGNEAGPNEAGRGGGLARQNKEGRMLKEFQEFISRGNVMDLAVGVIIGAAFGRIVDSLVSDIIMPIIGAIFGGLDFDNYFLPLSSAVNATSLAEAKRQGAVFAYGSFITVALNFIILAFIIFLMVKAVNDLRRRLEREKPAAPAAAPPADVALLTEIRDLLARK
jgi:large conductance mechanosensitive channel